MNFEDFKRKLAENIFSATSPEELSVKRTFEIADEIAEYVIKIAKEYINNIN